MTGATPLRRHVSITVDGSTLDIAGGADHTIASAVTAYGIPFDGERFAIVDSDGTTVPGATTLAQLADGAHVSVVDNARRERGGPSPTRVTGRTPNTGRAHLAQSWWMLGAAGGVLSLSLIVVLSTQPDAISRATVNVVAIVAGAGALMAALAIARLPATHAPLATAAAALLSFAGGAAAAPPSARALQLAVVFGLTAVALVMTVLVVMAQDARVRAMASTVGTIAVVFAVVWALTLFLDWPEVTAGAISLGLVAPGLKFLPGTLLNVPEGYSISYHHFMSQRWSVRGEVPEDPGPIVMKTVAPMIAASHARLMAGTASLSVAAVIFAPTMLPAASSTSTLVAVSAWVAVLATVIVLGLLPRNASHSALRWVPRGAAMVLLVEAVWFTAPAAGLPVRTVAIGAVLLVALIAAVLIVPLARGTNSLFWSRLTDTIEKLAAVIALPAALLAADMLELVRTAMAG